MFAQQTVFTTDGVQRKVFKDTGSKERYGVETKVVSTKMVFTNGGFKSQRVKMKGIWVEMKGIGVEKIFWVNQTGSKKDGFHNRRIQMKGMGVEKIHWCQQKLFSQQVGSKRMVFTTNEVTKDGFHHRRGPKGRFPKQQGQNGRYRKK